ncbi:1-phosphatidylinositol 4,5-bisphosphate phosphodiesterase zeta-1-like isoform X2 [Clytia hemisphaerica]|uniref:Phosphoinositide phospholipase C n=2 Tax=Clytia hemisphaerica TaxID=252671 RepID=A0A7M5TV11_9CNID
MSCQTDQEKEDIELPTDKRKQDLVDMLWSGSKTVKRNITNGRGRARKKTIILDADNKAFRYEPSSKGATFKIPFSKVTSITHGTSLPKEDIRSNALPTRQFVVEYQLENSKGENVKSRLHFTMETKKAAKDWAEGLQYLQMYMGSVQIENSLRPAWLRNAFDKFDHDNNGALTLTEIKNLLTYCNVKIDESKAEETFKKHSNESFGRLPPMKFSEFFYELVSLRRQSFIFERYLTDNKKTWNTQNIYDFLKNEQKIENPDPLDCGYIMNKYGIKNSEQEDSKAELDLIGFVDYLTSSDNDVIIPEHRDVYQDMTQPLSHYFINSSHNTYLLGGQLQGQSSVEGYVNALKRGCKCVEIDCWDGDNGEPIVYHGHTLTTKILFKDVITAIEQNFDPKGYPLILSLENHCSVAQQQTMARYLKTILGDKLYDARRDNSIEQLPSPEFFRGKILIKGKKLPEHDHVDGVRGLGTNDGEDDYVSEDDDEAGESLSEIGKDVLSEIGIDLDELEQENEMNEETNIKTHVQNKKEENSDTAPCQKEENSDTVTFLSEHGPRTAPFQDINDSQLVPDDRQNSNDDVIATEGLSLSSEKLTSKKQSRKFSFKKSISSKKTKKLKLSHELSDLVNYIQAVHFHGFESASQGQQEPFKMSSIGERKFQAFAKSHGKEFSTYNKKFLTRTYPSGIRVDSSNYNPATAWAVGCQIVALNYQTPGEFMDLNDGFFKVNGASGYILKPEYLRDENINFDPEDENLDKIIQPMQVTFEIISGHFLPNKVSGKDILDPYVVLNVYGIEQDVTTQFTTRTVSNNGFNPVFNATLQFILKAPELACFRLTVYDKDFGKDDLVAQCVYPFKSIRQGFRRIKLDTRVGESVNEACILANIKLV